MHGPVTEAIYFSESPPSTLFSFFLHTYLIGLEAIKKAFQLPKFPALHSAVEHRHGSPSGAPPVEFLLFFHDYYIHLSSVFIWPMLQSIVPGTGEGVDLIFTDLVLTICSCFSIYH